MKIRSWKFPMLLVLALLPGLCLAAPQAKSTLDGKAHGYAERRLDFEQAWVDASPEDRARLTAEIRRYRNVGLAALGQLSSARLVRWTRVLRGHSIPRLPSALGDWVAQLELRVKPGWCTVESLETNPQVVVSVLAPSQPPGFSRTKKPAQLVLHWVDAQGQRTLARTTPVRISDFTSRGFELFLQIPKTGAGDWTLEPSLELDDKVLWGHPARLSVLPGNLEAPGLESAKVTALARLARIGFRDMRWGGFDGMRAATKTHEAGSLLEPEPLGQALILRADPDGGGKTRALVWVVVPGNRLLEGEFLGQRGLAWSALAAEGVSIVASHAPLAAGPGGGDTASTTLAKYGPELGKAPRILVVRGNLARGLGLGSSHVFDGFDALVLQASRFSEAAPMAPFGTAPTLFLLPTDPWAAPSLPETQRAVVGMDPPLVVDMDLPRYIQQNLDFLADRPENSDTPASPHKSPGGVVSPPE